MINSTIICDHELKIIYVNPGFFGRTNDLTMLKEGDISKHITQLFSNGEYIMGDGIYPMKTWLVPVKRPNRNNPLTGSEEKFNKIISSMRVKIENCFALLKGRFRSLEELRLDMNNKDEFIKHSRWLRVCCILHNFLLEHDLDQSYEYFIEQFYKDHQEIKREVDFYKNYNFDDEDDPPFMIQTEDEEEESKQDLSDEAGKEKWIYLKRLILEEKLGKDIENLDRKHRERNRY